MINSKNMVAMLRRDASYLGRAVGVVVFFCFAALALAAAIIDLMALRH